jgi:CubicO group peptidase (beta-lactamase class C family)
LDIHGTCDSKFDKVKDAFERNFTERNDVGASVAVSIEGEYVVDLWGGYRDRAQTLPWEEDTIVNVYSTTKTMAAICALLLADRGELDLYAPVRNYWPEFAQNGKDGVEVRHFLSHSAGLSGMDEPMLGDDLYDWDKVVDALARQAPWWEPGTASGYHALTQGHLGADFHIGTGPEHDHRIGELIPPAKGSTPEVSATAAGSIAARTFANPAADASKSGTTGWRRAEIPAANGHGNARSVVGVQTLVANLGTAFGRTLMSEAGCRVIFDEQCSGQDLVLDAPIRFGMGYGLTSDIMPMGPNENIAYWGGWGGSTAVIDQDARMCVSYVMNRMEASVLGDPRGFLLLQAAYQSL